MRKLALLTACDAAYLPGAVGLFRSAARHHPDVDRICVVPSAEVERAAAALGPLARVIPPPFQIDGVPDRFQMAYAKLYLPMLVGYDAAVWADTDVVFCRPTAEFWAAEPGRVRAVACPGRDHRCHHNLPSVFRPRFAELYPALCNKPGFNSGLIGLRPQDWPDLAARFDRVVADVGCANFAAAFFDQPLLNAVMEDNVDYLPPDYNWSETFDNPPPYLVRAVHFTSRPKPWEASYPRHEPAYWYWVRYGIGEANPLRLAAVRGRILSHTPRRLAGRWLRAVK